MWFAKELKFDFTESILDRETEEIEIEEMLHLSLEGTRFSTVTLPFGTITALHEVSLIHENF